MSSKRKRGAEPGTEGKPNIMFFPEAAGALGPALLEEIIGGGERSGMLTERSIQQAINASRGGMAARGLAGSGIAQRAEEDVATDIALRGAQQRANWLGGLISNSSSGGQPQQPRGIKG